MDPLHATHAIWIDPLSYDPMVDGPPYLPHQTGGKVASGSRAKQAEEEVISDLDALLQQGMKKYGDAPMSGLAVLLACIRAESMIHQAHHWQTRGASFYGDHQLFMRVYETTSGFIDGLAERVVGAGDHTLVQPLVQMGLMSDFSNLFYKGASAVPESEALPTLSLAAVAKSSILLAMVYDALEEKGLLSGGTDNLLQGIADKQEELVYLLKQRVNLKKAHTMTPKTALEVFQYALMTRRVASRFVEGMEHSSPEAMKNYLKDHPNADPKNHSVKKQDEEKGEGDDKDSASTKSEPITPSSIEKGTDKLKALTKRGPSKDPPEGKSGVLSAEGYKKNMLGETLPEGTVAFQIAGGTDRLGKKENDAYYRMDSNSMIQKVQAEAGGTPEGKEWLSAAKAWQQNEFLDFVAQNEDDLDTSDPEKFKKGVQALAEKHLKAKGSKRRMKSWVNEVANMSPDDYLGL